MRAANEILRFVIISVKIAKTDDYENDWKWWTTASNLGKVVFLFGSAQFKKSGFCRLQKAENIRFGERMFSILTWLKVRLIESIIQFCCFFFSFNRIGKAFDKYSWIKDNRFLLDFFFVSFYFSLTCPTMTVNSGN